MTANDYVDCFPPELVVIPCGSRKLGRRARAADLYVGSYHRACRRAADALGPDRQLILSARYGLLDPTSSTRTTRPMALPTPSRPKPY